VSRLERPALVALALLATGFVAGGVPVLRHDWSPIDRDVIAALESIGGWNPMGLGSPSGYPSYFLLVVARAVLASIVGPYASHVAFFLGINLLTSFGAARLARILGADVAARIALAACAFFNPWTYTETVAGHSFMLLAYAATFWLIAECCRSEPSDRVLVPIVLAIAPQIQFLIIDSAFFLYLGFRLGRWKPVMMLGLMWLPVAVAVTMARSSLAGIPFTLEWERSQSVPLGDAALLAGYFTHYSAALGPVGAYAVGALGCIAALGVVIGVVRGVPRTAALVAALSIVPMIAATGTSGPIAAEFVWAVGHASPIAVFRELYDVLGFTCIGYVGAGALASRFFRPASFALGATALALVVGWCLAPPQRFFVYQRSFPTTAIDAPRTSRFVLLPALYPVTTDRGGSGLDPDFHLTSGAATAANEYVATYPFTSALGRFLRDGSTQAFAALGVARLYDRPWLRSDPTVEGQLAIRPPPAWLFAHRTHAEPLDALAPLTLCDLPAVATLGSRLGAGNILYSDAIAARGPGVPTDWQAYDPTVAVTAPNEYVDARSGWVDARLAFVELPEIAQPYGGAFTLNATALLPLSGGDEALVWVRGSLHRADGGLLTKSTGGYRWITLGAGAGGVTCSGECAVAVEGHPPSALPLDPPTRRSIALPFDNPLPWLAFTSVPNGTVKMLRLNDAYDPHWTAWLGGVRLTHIRVDGVVNGWIVPDHPTTERVTILEVGAACVALAELIAAAGVAILLGSLRTPTKPKTRSVIG